MKKAFLVLGLMFVLTCLVYSQNISFSGYINSGLGFGFNDADDSDPFIAARANDAEQNGFRFRLNGQYTNEAETAGARFRFQMQGGGLNPTISHAWGWMNFFDGMIQLNGGRIEESTWTTGDFWLASDSVSRFSGDGALLKIMPFEGLIFGAGAYVTGRDGNQVFQSIEGTKFTGHLTYTMKGIFRVDVSYRTDTWIDNPEYATDPTKPKKIAAHSGTSGDGPSMLFADIRLLAVKDFTAIAATHLNNLDDFSNIGTMTFSETFGYKINDNLSIGLNAVQFLSNVDNYDPGLFFNPWITYAINKVVPRLDLVYMMAGRSNFVSNSQAVTRDANWFRHGFNATGNNDSQVFNIRPSVTINIDNRTKLEIGDSFYIDNYKIGQDSKQLMTNVFYIDMIFSF